MAGLPDIVYGALCNHCQPVHVRSLVFGTLVELCVLAKPTHSVLARERGPHNQPIDYHRRQSNHGPGRREQVECAEHVPGREGPAARGDDTDAVPVIDRSVAFVLLTDHLASWEGWGRGWGRCVREIRCGVSLEEEVSKGPWYK